MIPFVFWLQDVIGVATHRLLRRKIPLVGEVVGRHYLALEARLLRRSDAVVSITDDFRPLLRRWRVDDARISTIENWTGSLLRLLKRPSGAADWYPMFRQIHLINRYGRGRRKRPNLPKGGIQKGQQCR